ncbi:WbqC family protein [Dyadobacter helix]|nr:WbqC family protein [Dyadobacter sp. CECT 9275]
MNKNIVITQSNYIPWKGFFDSIALADEFVVYDDMQYTKRDWRNRNLIKTPQGLRWITIPVEVKGKYNQKINETKISDRRWNKVHWSTLKQNYCKAKCYNDSREFVEHLYMTVNSDYLTEVNLHFITNICKFLGIDTNIRLSSEFILKQERSERLLDICLKLDGTDYYSGPAAKSYINEKIFVDAGVRVHYFDYSSYKHYEQLYPPFEHGVSILDLIFNVGNQSINYLKAKSGGDS